MSGFINTESTQRKILDINKQKYASFILEKNPVDFRDFDDKYFLLSGFAALINAFIPLLMAIDIYCVYIQ